MGLKRFIPYLIAIISVIVFAAPIIEITNNKNDDGLIEVCDKGIVYVPQGTAFVKCHGVLKKVIKIEPANSENANCYCPTCCNGQCYVFILCEPISNYSNEFYHGEIDRKESRTRIDYCRLWTMC